MHRLAYVIDITSLCHGLTAAVSARPCAQSAMRGKVEAPLWAAVDALAMGVRPGELERDRTAPAPHCAALRIVSLRCSSSSGALRPLRSQPACLSPV